MYFVAMISEIFQLIILSFALSEAGAPDILPERASLLEADGSSWAYSLPGNASGTVFSSDMVSSSNIEKEGDSPTRIADISVEGKGLTMGSSSTSNSLKFGQISLLGGQIEYKTALRITLPSIDMLLYNLDSFTLTVKRSSGNLTTAFCYAVSGVSYENLTGLTNPTLTYADSSPVVNGSAQFDITAAALAAYQASQSSLVLMLEGHQTNKLAEIVAPGSTTGSPLVAFQKSLFCGTAQPFEFAENPYYNGSTTNCLQYALGYLNGSYNVSPFETELNENNPHNVDLDYLPSRVANALSELGVFRILNGYMDYINPNERRIACRLKISTYGNSYVYDGDYHFMRQLDNGGWAQKSGVLGPFGYYDNNESILSDSIWGFVYNSPTVFLAYQDGGMEPNAI